LNVATYLYGVTRAFRIYLYYVTLTLKIETAVGTETLDKFQDMVQLDLEN